MKNKMEEKTLKPAVKPALKPRQRFPEFREAGEWKKKNIGKVLIEQPRPISMGDEDEYSLVTVKRRYGGVVSRGLYKGKSIKVKTQFLLQENDFLISKRQIVHCACGLVPKALEGSIVSNEYSVLRARDGFDISFFNYFSQQPKVSQSFLRCSIGIVIEKMLFNLDDWLKQEFLFPFLPEQQKIADCLTSIDALITAQGQKLDTLKAHKKGLMQQLFPAEGETLPKLRFPEFRDAGEWQPKTIGDSCETFSGGTPSTSNKEFYGGKIPFIRSAEVDMNKTELFLTNEGLANSAAKMVRKGDVLVALYGANSGDVALAKIDGAINQAILCLRHENNNAFVYQYLSHKQNWIISTYIQGGQGNLSGEIIKSIQLHFSCPDEQQKIADCLSYIDELITAEAQKLDMLKAHKKGLMQQLFPTLDEVQG